MTRGKTGRFFIWKGKTCSVTHNKVYPEYEGGYLRLDHGSLREKFDTVKWVECTAKGACVLKELNKLNQKEEKIMLTIKDVTLINGLEAKKHNMDQLLGFITSERDEAEKLRDMEVNSKAVDKRIKQLEANIKRLIQILDEKE